jgi:hypothetical protein
MFHPIRKTTLCGRWPISVFLSIITFNDEFLIKNEQTSWTCKYRFQHNKW